MSNTINNPLKNFIKMKKNIEKSSGIMKVLALTVMLAFISPVMTNAQAGKTNFSGTWALNAEKSTMPQAGGNGGGGGGMRMGGNMTVKQEGNNLSVSRTFPGRDGGEATTRTTEYTLDGKEKVNTTQRGESKSTANWSPDGKSLTVKTTSDFNGNTFTSTAVWTMTDANTLSVKTTSPGRDGGERTTTMVYDKK